MEGHLTPGDLAAYHAGRLTDERKGQIKDHLAVCEECALLYDSLIEFEQYRPEPDPSGEDPSAAAWLRFRERLRKEEAAEAPAQEETRTVVQPLQRRKVPVWEKPAIAWAVAAVMALCVVGLGIRSMTPGPTAGRSEPRFSEPRIKEPEGQVISLGLDGEEDVSRGAGEEPLQEPIDSAAQKLEYEIRLPGTDPEALYEVEILDTGDKLLWSGRGKPSEGYLELELGRSYLPAGAYRFRVHKMEGNGAKTLVGTTESFNVS